MLRYTPYSKVSVQEIDVDDLWKLAVAVVIALIIKRYYKFRN